MTTVTVSSTAYTAEITGGNSITISSTPRTVEIRGGIVGPAVAGLSTTSTTTKQIGDVLAWSTARSQYEPARLTADSLVVTFLADLVFADGSLDFSFAEAGALGMIVGFL